MVIDEKASYVTIFSTILNVRSNGWNSLQSVTPGSAITINSQGVHVADLIDYIHRNTQRQP
jgi:hypothetical protein